MTYVPSPVPAIVNVDGKEVYSSGFVHLSGNREINITLGGLIFSISFKSDGGGARFSAEPGATTNALISSLHFHLFNHTNVLGEGKLDPIEVGTLRGKPLFFSYYVNTLDPEELARRFEYCFYLGK